VSQWRILATALGTGSDFLSTWQAWRADPKRPRLLHYVALAASGEPVPGIPELASRWRGMTPGLHRFSFEEGRVILTVGIGDRAALLRELDFTADAIHLDDAAFELGTLKAIARLCREGTALVAGTLSAQLSQDLATCGFDLAQRRYAPAWPIKGLRGAANTTPARALVLGAGLAGAAVAASLARRGWQVEVLDAAPVPAAGASALPAGLLAPHQSPDDNLLSRLSRAGVRIALQECAALLADGDWQAGGALEHRWGDARPVRAVEGLEPWTRDATPEQLRQASLAADEPAWWHESAAWVRPAALVRAWLAQEGVSFRGACSVGSVERTQDGWQVMAADGSTLAQAPVVVIAAAHASGSLLAARITTHPVRGQVSWALHDARAGLLPPFPVNGHGHFIPHLPTAEGPAWCSGSTYGRGDADIAPRPEDQAANLTRLRELLPAVANALAPQFEAGQVRAWSGVRCTSLDRRPLVGELEPGLWVSTAMGSRGLTFAALCGELIAARLHAEPLPLERKLAASLDVRRLG
jgi:tRNA 5-methylaminomethyl-2-thiouridine biosynthesis bifunctional protein